MNGRELKEVLVELGITQSEFARLICVTSRAVTLWISGERPVPGPVESYVRLLHSLPFSLRQIEINRIKEGRSGMRDGIFAITFQGQQSSGVGVLIFENGRIYGTDEAGVQYDGMYVYDERTSLAEITIKVTFPPNIVAVFGISNPYEWAIDVTTSFNPNQNSGGLAIKTSIGKFVKAQYKFLRNLPEAA